MDNNTDTWNLPSLNYRNPTITSTLETSSAPIYNRPGMLNTPLGRVQTSAPAPPLPARPSRSPYNNSYSSYSAPYSSYGYGGYTPSYSGFGSYGGYGGYGFGGYRPGFSSFGYGSGGYYGNLHPENRFIQFAEESSRPAFQSIQSILHMFSSVTMMFESSFHAIYSSYMSVLGVADNFGKLRTMFGQVFSTFAVIRTLNWIFRKLLYLLGIRKEDFSKESIWSDALNEVSEMNSENRQSTKKQTWPMLIFMSIIIGGPYLLFKLMSKINPNPIPEIWVPANHPGSLAIGLYEFQAGSEQELSFAAQQKLMIAPKNFQPRDCPGWLLACNENRRIGLVPSNYVGMIMQSQKTGQTYLEHNGQTYQSSANSKNVPGNPLETGQNITNGASVIVEELDNKNLERINELSEE